MLTLLLLPPILIPVAQLVSAAVVFAALPAKELS